MIDLEILRIDRHARSIYVSLLQEREHTPETIAAQLRLPKCQLESALHALCSIGLVHITTNGRVRPVDPRLGISAALARRRKELIRELEQTELAELMHSGHLIHDNDTLDSNLHRDAGLANGTPVDRRYDTAGGYFSEDEHAEVVRLRSENARLRSDYDLLRQSMLNQPAPEDNNISWLPTAELPPRSTTTGP